MEKMKTHTYLEKIFSKVVLLMFIALTIIQPPALLMAQNQEFEEANQIMQGMNESLKEVNADIEQVQSYYQQLKDCLSGAGETGTECQQYIDLLYNMEGGGIELQDQVMTVKELGNQIIQRFEETNAFQMLNDAAERFGSIGTMVDNSANAMAFAQKFNPEGAREDPTRALRMIGEAIGGAAGSLPYPMDKIFEGYANSVTVIIGRLNQLQNKIEEARQGSLGASYSGYAAAQEFFDTNFASNSRLSIEFFDVTSQFRLLGGDVQVFQNLGSLTSEYYVYKGDTNRGWIAPTVFSEIYNYFEAVPSSDKSEVTVGYRAELIVSQAISNPRAEINEAKEHYNTFREIDTQFYVRRILEEMQLLNSMNSLVEAGEDAFIGYWLLIASKHREIRNIVEVITGYVYSEGKVLKETESGREPAPGELVTLTVSGGGTGQVSSEENGDYFVYTRGREGSDFTITAGQGEERFEESGNFYQQGFDGFNLILKSVEEIPVSLTISPAEASLEIDGSVSFTVFAVFDDESTRNVTELATWNTGSSSFTATEAGETTVTATYLGLSASAVVIVEEAAPQCNEPSEVLDEETGNCVCNTAEGYEMNEELGKCINIDEALEEVTEEGDALCDEQSLIASLARLDEIVASGNRLAANFRATVNKFMKEVNDQNSDICENTIIAAAFAGAKDQQAEYQVLVDEATRLSTDLILESSLCPLEDVEIDINSILQKISQLGPIQGEMEDGLAMMEDQLQQQSCDTQEVEDQGDTIAERDDPEVIQAGGTGATEICGDGIDNDGNGLIDDGCAGASNFNVTISLYDSGNLADDVFGLSVSGQGNLGNTPEGGLRVYPLRLSPGSYVATITVIKAPDNQGTYTISIMEGSQVLNSSTGSPPQGSVIDVPFSVGGNSDATAETESMLPMLMNSMRQIDQTEGSN
ncbi:DUF3869 domain-containing protein [Rhodohalobacter sp. WB101]|uniref:DUF3869 domain-containing protein n=2 Tax=Rhodohalobacter sulfatireducens TaxID=2911366 RepID=A0ABS9K949_9BACT|nr:DUF3869 domain-containing protein [Rhodohalobacter sulfatireducens]